MGANTSVYTRNSTIPSPMRDYPWSELPESPTKEQLELDVPLELSLWGLLGIFMFCFVKIGVLGLYADTDFKLSMLGNNEENPNGIHKVDLTLYLVNGIAYLVKAAINTLVVIFGLIFYCTRV